MPQANGIGKPPVIHSQNQPHHQSRAHSTRPLHRTHSRSSQFFHHHQHDSAHPPRRQLSTAQLSSKLNKGQHSTLQHSALADGASGTQRPSKPNNNVPSTDIAKFPRPADPILTLKPQAVSTLNPADLESVYSLWTVFSKCANVLENGHRLENLSWRLWNRELLYESKSTTSQKPSAKLKTGKPESSTTSVPGLHQVPKLSSSVDSSASTCTTSSNQKGSNDKLQTARSSPPSALGTSKKKNQDAAVRSNPKKLSTDRLRELLKLFDPNSQDEPFRPYSKRRSSSSKSINSAEKELAQVSSLANSHGSNTSSHSNTPVAPHQPTRSKLNLSSTSHLNLSQSTSSSNVSHTSSNSNVSRQSSLFQNSRPPLPSQQSSSKLTNKLPPPASTSNDSAKSNSSQGLFRKQSPRAQFSRQDSSQRLAGKVPSGLSMTGLASKIASNAGQNQGMQRTTSSLFPKAAPTKRPSLFSSTNLQAQQQQQQKPREPARQNLKIGLQHSRSSLNEFSTSDTDEDSSGSDFEGIDSNGSKLTYRHRTSTSTSIVRGFSPTSVSVSAIPKSFRSSTQVRSTNSSKPPPAKFEMTKARPDKVAREKMFFIESSSPSESDAGSNSLSSQSGFGSAPVKNPAEPQNSSNTAAPERHPSLFSNPPAAKVEDSSVKPEGKNISPEKQTKNDEDDDDDYEDDDEDDSNDDDDDDDDGDDDSAWDSVDDESDSGSFSETAFVRDENKPKPLTRPSILSSLFLNNPEKLMEEQNKGAASGSNSSGISNMLVNSPETMASQRHSVSPVKARPGSLAGSTSSGPNVSTLAMTARANPSAAAAHQSSITLNSPRTTRRNMFASELSESVRRDLLWERKQNSILNPMHTLSSSQAAGHSEGPTENDLVNGIDDDPQACGTNPQLVRRHTTLDMRNLNRVRPPVKFTMPGESWKQELDEESAGDFNYHARGW